MKKELALVREFHEKFLVPISDKPIIIPKDRSDLRYNLMREEVEEYRQGVEKQDLENITKELTDIIYVTYGTILEHGLQDKFTEIFTEVHRSNMTKEYRQYKVAKGENFSPADLRKILK